MTINERVSPKRLAEIIARAEVCDDSVLTDYRDIESIARELQQYRAGAEPVAERPLKCCDACIDVLSALGFNYKDARLKEVLKEVNRLKNPDPQVTSVQEEYAIKASGISDVLKDAADYAPLTAGQWHTLVKNWHQTFCGLAEGVAAPAVPAEQLSGNAEQVEPVSDANKLDGWIPVSERMPEFNDEVLVWHRHGFPMLAVYGACKDPITYKTYRCLRDNDGEIDVTHWMPLPAAPKQEAE